MEYKYIQKEDLVVGEIYHMTLGEEHTFIFKLLKLSKDFRDSEVDFISPSRMEFNKHSKDDDLNFHDFNNLNQKLRLASDSEIRQFNYCFDKKKYISLEDLPEITQDILDLESLIEESKKHL